MLCNTSSSAGQGCITGKRWCVKGNRCIRCGTQRSWCTCLFLECYCYQTNLEDYLETAPDTLETPAESVETPEVSEQKEDAGQKVVDRIVISSPITGIAADLATAPDEAFAQKMMGDGAVVTPEDPYVRAPEDGEVAFVFDTKHAIGFVTESESVF